MTALLEERGGGCGTLGFVAAVVVEIPVVCGNVAVRIVGRGGVHGHLLCPSGGFRCDVKGGGGMLVTIDRPGIAGRIFTRATSVVTWAKIVAVSQVSRDGWRWNLERDILRWRCVADGHKVLLLCHVR